MPFHQAIGCHFESSRKRRCKRRASRFSLLKSRVVCVMFSVNQQKKINKPHNHKFIYHFRFFSLLVYKNQRVVAYQHRGRRKVQIEHKKKQKKNLKMIIFHNSAQKYNKKNVIIFTLLSSSYKHFLIEQTLCFFSHLNIYSIFISSITYILARLFQHSNSKTMQKYKKKYFIKEM